MADYATLRGETPPVGGPFATPESSLTAILPRGENALGVSAPGESPLRTTTSHADESRTAETSVPLRSMTEKDGRLEVRTALVTNPVTQYLGHVSAT